MVFNDILYNYEPLADSNKKMILILKSYNFLPQKSNKKKSHLMKKVIPSLSKMWLKVINLEQSLFPKLEESMGSLSPKAEKLIKILDFAEIERFVFPVQITNPPKDREEMARAFVAKQVYNFQSTRELIDRLKIDRTLRVICGWRDCNKIPSESKFSRVFKEFSQQRIVTKAHDIFIENYLSETLFFYSSIDSTVIELREKSNIMKTNYSISAIIVFVSVHRSALSIRKIHGLMN